MIQQGTRFQVAQEEVFPAGCHLVPGGITEAQDYDEKTKTRRPAADKLTGKRVFSCRVIDLDPQLEGRSRETVVKVVADRMPVPPTGALFEVVSFEALTVTPYVNDRGRMAYSIRAAAIKAARPMRDAA